MPDLRATVQAMEQPTLWLFVWRCMTCGCLWRDNLNGYVSLFDQHQKSCQVCEMSGTKDACKPSAIRVVVLADGGA